MRNTLPAFALVLSTSLSPNLNIDVDEQTGLRINTYAHNIIGILGDPGKTQDVNLQINSVKSESYGLTSKCAVTANIHYGKSEYEQQCISKNPFIWKADHGSEKRYISMNIKPIEEATKYLLSI